MNRLREIIRPDVHLVMGDEVNLTLKKIRNDITILPIGRREYLTASQEGKSITVIVLVSNLHGILGYKVTYDTNYL